MRTRLKSAYSDGAPVTRGRYTPRLLAIVALLMAPVFAVAAGVSVKLDFSSPSTSPFPSDRFTQPDWTQNTFKRVKLPKPDCAVQVSDCADIDVINTLDGFNTQPRITVPFTGDIDPSSVTSETVYLVNLGDTLSGLGFGQKVGINQVSWDVAGKTLVFESDELLQEHSRYVLVVTTGVRDAAGDPIEAGRWGHFRQAPSDEDAKDRDLMDYRKSLMDGEHSARSTRYRIAALSLFTTQSISADLRKIHRQIAQSKPVPVNFMIGNGGSARAVFPVAGITDIQWAQQTGVAPAFTNTAVPLSRA